MFFARFALYKLRPYQEAAVAATLANFRQNRDPALLVLPTGAGKSLVIAELSRIAKGRVLVLAHVKELVEQNHAKYESYGLTAGIYSAGLDRKDSREKVIFGSIQSVARARDDFFQSFSLLIIDECHRVATDDETQYAQVIKKIRASTPTVCILGLTATPYRLGLGWLYQFHAKGILRTKEERFFKRCIFELTLRSMIERGYLTPPIKIDSPVASYDFSALKLKGERFVQSEIEAVLKSQERITPSIVSNIVDLAKDRQGVMIFSASVRHAEEILSLLPRGEAALVVGETAASERDDLIRRFKERSLKYLVNVSVLTTGFDAPHVDLIAILRPTESVALYQQIVGRGLRLSEGKVDCLILDYTGVGHDIFAPVIDQNKPSAESVPVVVPCPECGHENDFWGITTPDGEIIEHFGRRCQGAHEDPRTHEIEACSYRFRFKRCGSCGAENDIAARICLGCQGTLVDADKKLKEAMSLKDAHIMRPDSMELVSVYEKKSGTRLEVRYYDYDGQALKEAYFLNHPSDFKALGLNFIRMHLKRPELRRDYKSVEEVVASQHLFRLPMFVIARKDKKWWTIREKIFDL